MDFAMFIKSVQHPSPKGKSNGIAKGFISVGIRLFFDFPLGVRPVSDVSPSVRESLESFALQWGKAANDLRVDYCIEVVFIRHPLSPPAFREVRVLHI